MIRKARSKSCARTMDGAAGSETFLARSLIREADQLAAWPEQRILEGVLPPILAPEGTDVAS